MQSLHKLQTSVELRWDATVFRLICLYLLAQSYTIPIIPWGPSWTIWLTLPDCVVLCLLAYFAIKAKHPNYACYASKRMFLGLVLLIAACGLSYLVFTVLLGMANIRPFASIEGIQSGLYQLVRLAEFAFVFFAASTITVDETRIRRLRRVSEVALGIMCICVWLTYFEVVSTKVFGFHLLRVRSSAGPWGAFYLATKHSGWGTISYNHAYVALQIICMAALRLSLGPDKYTFREYLLVTVLLGTVFLTESRAGIVSALIFSTVILFRQRCGTITYVVVLLFSFILVTLAIGNLGPLASTLSRFQSITSTGSLSDRLSIWHERFAFLNEEPTRWIVGNGFGTAIESGRNAHMLALQIVLETGVLGLIVFAIFARQFLSRLRDCDTRRTFFTATIALLVTSATQETFYPVPASGQFLGLYLCSAALVFQKSAWQRNLIERSDMSCEY